MAEKERLEAEAAEQERQRLSEEAAAAAEVERLRLEEEARKIKEAEEEEER